MSTNPTPTAVKRLFEHAAALVQIEAALAATLAARKPSELFEDCRAAIVYGGEHARQVQKWIAAELCGRLGSAAADALIKRAGWEARERTIPARQAQPGDIHVTREAGMYVRREILDVTVRPDGKLVELACLDDGNRLLLGAEQPIVVERGEPCANQLANAARTRPAVGQPPTPAPIDLSLARRQRDWLLALQDAPAGHVEIKTAKDREHLDGIINLLDAVLDTLEGYAGPLEVA